MNKVKRKRVFIYRKQLIEFAGSCLLWSSGLIILAIYLMCFGRVIGLKVAEMTFSLALVKIGTILLMLCLISWCLIFITDYIADKLD